MRSDWLEAFLTFSECLNFTHAAERLHLSQPALHVKIKKLSATVGAPLYLKQGRVLVLTDTGRRIQSFARELRERNLEFMQEIRTGTSAHPVVLAAGEGAYLYLLGSALSAFRKSSIYPLQLLTTDATATVKALLSGQAHLGVTANAAYPDELDATQFTTVKQLVVVPRHHPLAKKTVIKIKDLGDETFILPSKERPLRIAVEQAFANKSQTLRVAMEANGWELMLHFVKLGMGICIVNSCCNIPAILVAIPIPELPSLTYHILQRKSRWRTEAAVQLKDKLLKHKDQWQN